MRANAQQLLTLLLGAVLLLGSTPSAEAKWGKFCKSKDCLIAQKLVTRDGKVIARFFVQKRQSADAEAIGSLMLPLGLSIPAGVRLKIDDGAQIEAKLQECVRRDGCRATFPISKKLASDLIKGKTLFVMLRTSRSAKLGVLRFSLMGFEAAYGSIDPIKRIRLSNGWAPVAIE